MTQTLPTLNFYTIIKLISTTFHTKTHLYCLYDSRIVIDSFPHNRLPQSFAVKVFQRHVSQGARQRPLQIQERPERGPVVHETAPLLELLVALVHVPHRRGHRQVRRRHVGRGRAHHARWRLCKIHDCFFFFLIKLVQMCTLNTGNHVLRV